MRGRGSTLLPLLRTLTSRQGHAEAAVATRASSVSLTTTSESTSDSAGREVGKGPLRGFALPQFWESRAQRQAHRSLNSASALEVCPHIFVSRPGPPVEIDRSPGPRSPAGLQRPKKKKSNQGGGGERRTNGSRAGPGGGARTRPSTKTETIVVRLKESLRCAAVRARHR